VRRRLSWSSGNEGVRIGPSLGSLLRQFNPTLVRRISAPLAFGLIGMITGASGLYLSWRTAEEESAVVLSAYASASRADVTSDGFGLRVELVNASLRPVIVRSASLVLDGGVAARASGYLDDPKLLDRARAEPALIGDSASSFPIGLGAREGRSVVLLMDVWRPLVAAETARLEQAARKQLVRLLAVLAALPAERRSDRLLLRLEHEPGGEQEVPVQGLSVPPARAEVTNDAAAMARTAPPQAWIAKLHEQPGGAIGLMLRRTVSAGGRVELVLLDVWRERSAFHRQLVRPVVGQQSTLFPLPSLERGAYIATFRLADRVVAYKSFAVLR
jgi:hypothetical protein